MQERRQPEGRGPSPKPSRVQPTTSSGYRLLASLAHPDDETFGLGGPLAYYATRGIEVHVICATKGEAGTVFDPTLMEGFNSIAERRVAELECAAKALGLTEIHFLGYRDSGMPGSPDNQHPEALMNADETEVADRIAAIMQKVRPHVVVTFDPIGGYFHPDHIAMHKATTRAFMALREAYEKGEIDWAPAKLYYHFFPRHRLRWLVKIMPLLGLNPRKAGANKDVDLVAIAEGAKDFRTHALIDYQEVVEKVWEATMCHKSQLHAQQMSWRERLVRRLSRPSRPVAHFMRAYPPVRPGEPVERDLFLGLE